MRSSRRILTVSAVLVLSLLAGTAVLASGAPRIDGSASPHQRGAFSAEAVSSVGDWTIRLHGANRYETAVAVSENAWFNSLPYVVYLATGENYPDALAMGASAFDMGPLLLTGKNHLPDETARELERLSPCFIVAVGGPGVISDRVLSEADSYTAPSDDLSCLY